MRQALRLLLVSSVLIGASAAFPPGAPAWGATTIPTRYVVTQPVAPVAGTTSPAQAQGGRIACRILENGGVASGTIVVTRGQQQVATGSCGSPVAVPAGQYTVVLRLDGALDRPEQTRNVTVAAGATASVEADFPTAILEVVIEADGRRAAGLAEIQRGGARVGTLGSGVAAHVSAGTYDVIVRYRTQERRFDAVQLARGQRRALRATF